MHRISEIQTTIEDIENNSSLFEENNFLRRIETIDFLEFQIIGELEKLELDNPQIEKFDHLKKRTESLLAALERINDTLFKMLLENIRTGKITGQKFKILINEYFDFTLYNSEYKEEVGYDNLDIFIDRLFPRQAMPEQTKDLEQGMIYYQKTPVRIVFEFINKIEFAKEDVFFDLGSGLGQVAILVNLLCGIKTKGVEIEPSFCDYARQSASEFKLHDVNFINTDARKVDYSCGTIFFMFTPFKDKILEEVLRVLKEQSQQRKIKIITYGPCTTHVAAQSWLKCVTPQVLDIYKPTIFKNM